jgi:4-amino-4-deoxy-L-arabinose transferase-like glycosyltransferase
VIEKSGLYGFFSRPAAPFIVVAVIALVRILAMGSYPIMDSTEARFADIALKMAETGDFVTPRYLSDEPYWGKPPFYFWVTAVFYQLFGVSETTARFPSFLFSMVTAVMVYAGASRLYDKATASLSIVVLSSTALFFALSGVVITDTALTTWVTLSLVAFIVSLHGEKRGRAWGYLFFLGLGMSLLTKGPVGVVLTLMPIASWAILRGRVVDVFRRLPIISGSLLVIVIAAPWYAMAELKTPGFLEYYFVGEHWKRFVVPGWEGSLYGGSHKFVRGTIWLFMLAGALPWIFLLAGAATRLMKTGGSVRSIVADDRALFFLLWFIWPSIFFTMAGNILYTYVLPGLPGFAVLTAAALTVAGFRGEDRGQWFSSPWVTWAAIAFAPIVLAVLSLTSLKEIADRKSQKEVVRYYLSERVSTSDGLIYYGKMTFSADFYSRGQARDIADMEREKVVVELDDGNLDFFAVKNDEIESFIGKAGERVKEAKRFAKYTLFVEK